MTGDPWHNIEPQVGTTPLPVPHQYHAYVQMKDLNDGIKYAARLAVDRARKAGNNPRNGLVTIYFDDNGVGAKWVANREDS
jgi:hypothetical protein